MVPTWAGPCLFHIVVRFQSNDQITKQKSKTVSEILENCDEILISHEIDNIAMYLRFIRQRLLKHTNGSFGIEFKMNNAGLLKLFRCFCRMGS